MRLSPNYRGLHPVCAASEASRLFLLAQPPLLFQEGSTRLFYKVPACQPPRKIEGTPLTGAPV